MARDPATGRRRRGEAGEQDTGAELVDAVAQERKLLLDELCQFVRPGFAQAVLDTVAPGEELYRSALQLVLPMIESMDAMSSLNLDAILPDGARDLIAKDALPELSPIDVARCWVMARAEDAEELPKSIRDRPMGAVFDFVSDDGVVSKVVKVPAEWKWADCENVIQTCLLEDGDAEDGDGAPRLWYHGCSYSRAELLLVEGIDATRHPKDGLDFGVGHYMADSRQYALQHTRRGGITHYVLFVYKECRTDAHHGLVYPAHPSNEWKQLVCAGQLALRSRKGFIKALKLLDMPDTNPQYIEGPYLKSHRKVTNQDRFADVEAIPDIGLQVVVRDEGLAREWDASVVAVLVFGCVPDAVTAGAAPDGDFGGTGAGAGAGAGDDAGLSDRAGDGPSAAGSGAS